MFRQIVIAGREDHACVTLDKTQIEVGRKDLAWHNDGGIPRPFNTNRNTASWGRPVSICCVQGRDLTCSIQPLCPKHSIFLNPFMLSCSLCSRLFQLRIQSNATIFPTITYNSDKDLHMECTAEFIIKNSIESVFLPRDMQNLLNLRICHCMSYLLLVHLTGSWEVPSTSAFFFLSLSLYGSDHVNMYMRYVNVIPSSYYETSPKY